MIITEETLEPFIKVLKSREKSIVLVGGCFDVIHEAHIEFLEKSKKQGDILILLLESDENIKLLKGPNRPKNSLETRAYNLDALGFIDLIVKLPSKVSDKYYYNLTKLICPDIIALTKNDPLTDKKQEQSKMVGGKIKFVMDRNQNHSTTKLINKK